MLRIAMGLTAVVVIAGCASTRKPDAEVVEDAVRFGIEACERHFLENVPMAEAVAASAKGRPFARVERRLEDWYYDPKPWRLADVDVWVGLDDDEETSKRCRVLAVDIGSVSLRDALMTEHVTKADWTWTTWPTSGGGMKAVCTTDRVPEEKSVLVTAYFQADMNLGLDNAARSPVPAKFNVSVVNEKTCSRTS